MKRAMTLTVCLSGLFWLAAPSARAEHKEYVGRTGLPTIREGKNEVWLERGLVTLQVVGGKLHATQVYRFRYPGPKIETGSQRVKVAVREDFFRDKSEGEIDPRAAVTFDKLEITVDDQDVEPETDSWMLNDKKDTTTRWHNVWMTFNPGETHTLRVESVAPIGWDGANRYIHFVTKDLSGLRKDPDLLEIRFEGPEKAGPVTAALEPKPSSKGREVARWVYRSSNPKRDILIKLPAGYRPEGS